MINTLTLKELLKIVSGKLVQDGSIASIDHIVTDSRKIITGPSSLFIALEGYKYDGHAFVASAYQSGVRNFILNESRLSVDELPEANILAVPDTLQALQSLGRWNRSFFSGPVVGITGSNGKTIVKEWLGLIVGTTHNVAKSPKSYNSQIGVPLSLLGIEAYHKIAVFEAGISTVGEMEKLERMMQPSIGLFTNLGTAHDEGFENKNQKLEEKLRLFANCRFIIYRKEQMEVAQLLENN